MRKKRASEGGNPIASPNADWEMGGQTPVSAKGELTKLPRERLRTAR